MYDTLFFIHGMGSGGVTGVVTNWAGALGDPVCRSDSQYSNGSWDQGGAIAAASSYPYIQQFPSYIEEGYTFPPEILGQGGIVFGLHIRIMTAFDNFTTILVHCCSGSSANPTYTANEIVARNFTLAQWQAAAAHYFIPLNLSQVLEYNQAYFDLTGSAPTTGTIIAYYGPLEGGEQ